MPDCDSDAEPDVQSEIPAKGTFIQVKECKVRLVRIKTANLSLSDSLDLSAKEKPEGAASADVLTKKKSEETDSLDVPDEEGHAKGTSNPVKDCKVKLIRMEVTHPNKLNVLDDLDTEKSGADSSDLPAKEMSDGTDSLDVQIIEISDGDDSLDVQTIEKSDGTDSVDIQTIEKSDGADNSDVPPKERSGGTDNSDVPAKERSGEADSSDVPAKERSDGADCSDVPAVEKSDGTDSLDVQTTEKSGRTKLTLKRRLPFKSAVKTRRSKEKQKKLRISSHFLSKKRFCFQDSETGEEATDGQSSDVFLRDPRRQAEICGSKKEENGGGSIDKETPVSEKLYDEVTFEAGKDHEETETVDPLFEVAFDGEVSHSSISEYVHESMTKPCQVILDRIDVTELVLTTSNIKRNLRNSGTTPSPNGTARVTENSIRISRPTRSMKRCRTSPEIPERKVKRIKTKDYEYDIRECTISLQRCDFISIEDSDEELSAMEIKRENICFIEDCTSDPPLNSSREINYSDEDVTVTPFKSINNGTMLKLKDCSSEVDDDEGFDRGSELDDVSGDVEERSNEKRKGDEVVGRGSELDDVSGDVEERSSEKRESDNVLRPCGDSESKLFIYTTEIADRKVCLVCEKKVSTRKAFQRHIRVAHRHMGPYTCMKCEENYFSFSGLITHMKMNHRNFEELGCRRCYEQFNDQSLLEKHLSRRHGLQLPATCIKCHYIFDNEMNLMEHVDEMHGGTLTLTGNRKSTADKTKADSKRKKTTKASVIVGSAVKERCGLCDMEVDVSRGFRKHNLSFHGDVAPYSCGECQETIFSFSCLIAHVRQSHQIQTVPEVGCRLCAENFKSGEELENHLKSHGWKLSLPCYECECLFAKKSALYEHVESAHRISTRGKRRRLEQEELKVEVSGTSSNEDRVDEMFGTNSRSKPKSNERGAGRMKSLRSKRRNGRGKERSEKENSESGDDLCDLKTMLKNSKFSLSMEVGIPTKSRKGGFRLMCQYCEQQFESTSEFRRHVKEHPAIYACEVCCIKFKSEKSLLSHQMSTHVDTMCRGSRCKICDDQFLSKESLKDHLLVHEWEEPVECSVCGYQVDGEEDLLLHLDTAHREDPYGLLLINSAPQSATSVVVPPLSILAADVVRQILPPELVSSFMPWLLEDLGLSAAGGMAEDVAVTEDLVSGVQSLSLVFPGDTVPSQVMSAPVDLSPCRQRSASSDVAPLVTCGDGAENEALPGNLDTPPGSPQNEATPSVLVQEEATVSDSQSPAVTSYSAQTEAMTSCSSHEGNTISLNPSTEAIPSVSTQDEAIISNCQSQDLLSGSPHSQTVPSDPLDCQAISSRYSDCQAVTSGSPEYQVMASGSPEYQVMASGSPEYQAITPGSPHIDNITPGSPHNDNIVPDSPCNQTVTSGTSNTQAVASGSPNNQATPFGSNHNQGTPLGSPHNQAMQSGSPCHQAMASGSPDSQAMASNHNQGMPLGSPHNQAMASGSPYNQATSSGSSNNKAVASDSLTNQAMASISPCNQAITSSFPHNEAFTPGSPHNDNITPGCPCNEAATLGTSNNQAVASGPLNNQAMAFGSNHNQAIQFGSPCNQAMSSGSPSNLTVISGSTNNQAVASGSPSNQAMSFESRHNQAMTSGSPCNQAITPSFPHNEAFNPGSSHNDNIPPGCPSDQTVISGTFNTQAVASGYPNNQATPFGSNHNQGTPLGSPHNQAMQSPYNQAVTSGSCNPQVASGSLNNQAMPFGSNHNQCMPLGSPHNQAIHSGSYNQAMSSVSPCNQDVTSGCYNQAVASGSLNNQASSGSPCHQAMASSSPNNQAMAFGSNNNQGIPLGSLHNQAVQSGSFCNQATSSGSPCHQSMASGSPNNQAMAFGSNHNQVIPLGSPHNQTIQSGSPYNQAVIFDSIHNEAITSYNPQTEALSSCSHSQCEQPDSAKSLRCDMRDFVRSVGGVDSFPTDFQLGADSKADPFFGSCLQSSDNSPTNVNIAHPHSPVHPRLSGSDVPHCCSAFSPPTTALDSGLISSAPSFSPCDPLRHSVPSILALPSWCFIPEARASSVCPNANSLAFSAAPADVSANFSNPLPQTCFSPGATYPHNSSLAGPDSRPSIFSPPGQLDEVAQPLCGQIGCSVPPSQNFPSSWHSAVDPSSDQLLRR